MHKKNKNEQKTKIYWLYICLSQPRFHSHHIKYIEFMTKIHNWSNMFE